MRVVLGAGEAGDDVYVGADRWFMGKFRIGGVCVDCASTLGGSGDGSLAVGRGNEACEGADGVIELAIGVADPDVDLPRRKTFLRGFFIIVVSVEIDVYNRFNWGEAGGSKEERLRTRCCVLLKFSRSQTLHSHIVNFPSRSRAKPDIIFRVLRIRRSSRHQYRG